MFVPASETEKNVAIDRIGLDKTEGREHVEPERNIVNFNIVIREAESFKIPRAAFKPAVIVSVGYKGDKKEAATKGERADFLISPDFRVEQAAGH